MTVDIPFGFEALTYHYSLQSGLGHFSREVKRIKIPRSTRNPRRERLVRHLRTGRARLHHVSILTTYKHSKHANYSPSHPVMYATPKLSGTTCVHANTKKKSGTENKKGRTSPQPYSRKCLEYSVDVLSTQ